MVRTSPLRNKEALTKAIESSSSISDLLKSLGLRAAGGNYRSLREACTDFGIPYPKYTRDISYLSAGNRIPDEKIFVKDSSYTNRSNIKKRLYASGVPEKCSECGTGPRWNSKSLTLTLEHINGVWNDNRRENLCILCPNCHSQTDTYAGRHYSKKVTKVYYCECGSKKDRYSKTCLVCSSRSREVIDWPNTEDLQKLVDSYGYSKTGRTLGVSDVAVRKRLANHKGL